MVDCLVEVALACHEMYRQYEEGGGGGEGGAGNVFVLGVQSLTICFSFPQP